MEDIKPDVRTKEKTEDGSITHLTEELSQLSPEARQELFSQFSPRGASASAATGDDSRASRAKTYIRKLKNFSGRTPVPSNEVDYATWRLFVLQYLADPEVKDTELKSAILQSLSGAALHTVQHLILSPISTARNLLDVLESAYNRIQDGHELVARVYEMLQSSKQTASDYCQHLYIKLTEALQMGGLHPSEFDLHLNRQFLRGCRDDLLLEHLSLDPTAHPLPFSDLIKLIRAEEMRRAERESRFGKSRMQSHMIEAESTEPTSDLASQVKDLQEQMKGLLQERPAKPEIPSSQDLLFQQVQNLQAMVMQFSKSASTEKHSPQASSYTPGPQTPRRRFTGFCYNCGEDGHVMQRCRSDANSVLVQQKLKAQSAAKHQRQQGGRGRGTDSVN